MARKKGSNGKVNSRTRKRAQRTNRKGGKKQGGTHATSVPRIRHRDYRAEYVRRIARAKARGISLSLGRGHPTKAERAKRDKLALPSQQWNRRTRRAQLREAAATAGHRDLWTDTARAVQRDADRKFGKGNRPKREKGEEPFKYADRIAGEAEKEQTRFPWEDEQEFVDYITALGLTERDAYTFWFSP